MKFSIVITAHKDRGFLTECILSCKTAIQYCDFKMPEDEFEVILASDGYAGLRNFAEYNKIKFCLSTPQKNMAQAFNNAIYTAVTGSYIKIIADDDILHPEGFYELCKIAKEKQPDVIVSNYLEFEKDKKKIVSSYKTEIPNENNDLLQIIKNRKIGCGTTLIKTQSFKKVGGMDSEFNISEGYILWLKMYNAELRNFIFADVFSVYYRRHSQQKSQNLTKEQMSERETKMNKINTKYLLDLKPKRINQCYVSTNVYTFKEMFLKKWGLKDYTDRNSPAVFFGMYEREDVEAVLKHNALAIIVWAGSDSITKQNIVEVNKPNVIHIASNKFIAEDLENAGVKNYKFLPITVVDHKKLNIKSLPLGDKIYVYIPDFKPLKFCGTDDFYGCKIVEKLIDLFGKERFIIAQPPSVQTLGIGVKPKLLPFTYTQEQLYNDIYKQCLIGLRLYAHDGLSETVVEMGLHGRKMIYNGIEPNAIKYNNLLDIVKAILKEEENIGKTMPELSQSMSDYIEIGDDWLYIDKKPDTKKITTFIRPPRKKRFYAAIPVNGRRPLLTHTITRLYKKCSVAHVICIGDNEEDKAVCESAGAEWVYHTNEPLGAKWNAGVKAGAKYKMDGFLFVGSSDWVSDNWISYFSPFMKEYDLVGSIPLMLLDIRGDNKKKLAHYLGYPKDYYRYGESVGSGRIYSTRILEKLNYEIFQNDLNMNMDYTSLMNVIKLGGKTKFVDDDLIKVMALSTDRWINKHRFENDLKWSKMFKEDEIDTFLEKWFPEGINLFNI